MVALRQLPRSISRPIQRITRSVESEKHPVVRWAGIAFVAFALYGVIAMLPDIRRYLRMRNM